MNILNTTDYDMFSFVAGNREVSKSHVEALKANIERNNLLSSQPILVNTKMEIIDGQHRLQAARELKVPIYYSVSENRLTIRDAQLLNTTQRRWTSMDFLRSYVQEGSEDYKKLSEFMDKYQLPLGLALHLLSGTVGQRFPGIYAKFKLGEFVVEDEDFAVEHAEKIAEIRRYCEEVTWKDRDFLKAVLVVWENMDHEQFLDTLSLSGRKVTRRANVIDYLRQFEDIYKAVHKKKMRLY